MCSARIRLSHRAASGRSARSVAHDMKWKQVGLRSLGCVHRRQQDSPPPIARRLVSQRDSPAVCSPLAWQGSAINMFGANRANVRATEYYCVTAATWVSSFANPCVCWLQTRQKRQTRWNAEGVRPVALLKAVAKC
jgi:hypothetical protein